MKYAIVYPSIWKGGKANIEVHRADCKDLHKKPHRGEVEADNIAQAINQELKADNNLLITDYKIMNCLK